MKFLKPFSLPLFFLGLLFLPATAQADAKDEYVDSILAEAKKNNLWDDRYWHILLHYRKKMLFGVESEIYDPRFYNSPDGRQNPKSELEATLRAFFRPVADVPQGEEHPQCNFPARLKWLKTKLNIDSSALPAPVCGRLDHWRESLDVNRVTLVFASYYMASPASMFGHTLLRLDKEHSGAELDLMNYGVNYAANMDSDNPIVMAYKGVFGLFEGTFSTFPYFMKVQEYGNMEARDLWEYQLSLNKEQIGDLILHLWEIGSMKFRYFYFRENCAFELLALMESGNPQLKLTDHFQVATVPTETVKVVSLAGGLVSKRIYRPSLTTQLDARRGMMSEAQGAAFKDLLAGSDTSGSAAYGTLSETEKAAVLDAFLDYQQYNLTRTRKDENEGLVKFSRKILLERSKLAAGSENPSIARPEPHGPEEGHGSNKFAFGFGANGAGGFERVSYRPAYQDLLSYGAGFAENSQIIYFDARAKYYNGSGKTVLEDFKLVDLVSVTPYDPIFKGSSWRVGFGLRNLKDVGCEECQAFYISFGDGYAVRAPFYRGAIFYGMLGFSGELAPKFQFGYRLGAGPEIGALLEESESWKTQIFGKAVRYPQGNVSNEYEIGLKQRYAVNKNTEAVLSLARVNDDNEAAFSIGAYF